MKAKIIELVQSSEKLEKFRKRNLDIAKNKLDWDINFNILEKIYSDLLN